MLISTCRGGGRKGGRGGGVEGGGGGVGGRRGKIKGTEEEEDPLHLVIRALLAGGIRELSNAGGIR